MSFEERKCVIEELSSVDEVISFNDDDDTSCNAIRQILETKGSDWTLIFANGGDRLNNNTPEFKVFGSNSGVDFVWKTGGSIKLNSSSKLLEKWTNQKTLRNWGHWQVLDESKDNTYKVKMLVIYPGCSLSKQKHNDRSEHWYVLEGCCLLTIDDNDYIMPEKTSRVIKAGQWHQASNYASKTPCKILEVQYGARCDESDIERIL